MLRSFYTEALSNLDTFLSSQRRWVSLQACETLADNRVQSHGQAFAEAQALEFDRFSVADLTASANFQRGIHVDGGD